MSRLDELRAARRVRELAVLGAVQAWIGARGLPPEKDAATWLTAMFGEWQQADAEYMAEVDRVIAEEEPRAFLGRE